jgi:hypothetical protein
MIAVGHSRVSFIRFFLLILVLATAGSFTCRMSAAQAASSKLLNQTDLVYQGAFRLPQGTLPGASYGFDYGTTGFAYYPAHNSLLVNNHIYEQKTAEVSIPQIVNSTNLNNLSTATLLQNPADITEGNLAKQGAGGATLEYARMGGLMVYGNKLIGGAFIWYDGGYAGELTHFTSGLAFSQTGDFHGMYKVGDLNAGFYSGYTTDIPQEWQSAFGGPALTGNCCISIISRTSFGPAAFVFNPDDLGVKNPVPATPVVYYDGAHPTLGDWGNSTTVNLYFNMATGVTGIVFPAGTRSVLFFGRQGTGVPCYGCGGSTNPGGDCANEWCYDPAGSSKGCHAYPYKPWVWAYDANDLLSVKNGQKNPWDIRPYAVWALDLPDTGGNDLQGVAYDPATRRLYVSQSYGDGASPLIHVFSISTGGDTTVPAPPRNLLKR